MSAGGVTVILDGSRMTDREALWDYLKENLPVHDYFGRNLDALYDELTEYRKPLTIKMVGREQMKVFLGRYGEMLIDTFLDAAKENGYLDVQI